MAYGKGRSYNEELSGKEKQLIDFIRNFGWGEMRIRVENNQPVLVYEAVKTIRLEEAPKQQKKKVAK